MQPQNIKTNNLGGPRRGYVAPGLLNHTRDAEMVAMRSILRNSWNGEAATNVINGYSRVVTPFRAVMNAGDFLGRVYGSDGRPYSCGGSNAIQLDRPGRGVSIGSMYKNCDTTGVPNASCNVKFVYDSSDYTRFRKQMANNRNFNDINFGGYSGHPNQSVLTRVRHGRLSMH